MPLLNFSTTVPVDKTVAEIQRILSKHGAVSIIMDYKSGVVTALSFVIVTKRGELPIRLPVDSDAVYRVLVHQNVPRRFRSPDQAERVAWRIIKDWVEAQIAILDYQMVTMEQIFLAYAILPSGQTVYEIMSPKLIAPPNPVEVKP